MEKRYKSLRIIGTFYKILGLVTAVFTVLLLLASCAIIFYSSEAMWELSRNVNGGLGMVPFMPYRMMGSVFGGLLVAFFVLAYGGGLALTLYALGEGVYLFISIEENTRTTAAVLAKQSSLNKTQDTAPPTPTE